MSTQTTHDLNAALTAAREAANDGQLTELRIAFRLIDLALSEGSAPLPTEWQTKIPAFGVNPLIDKMLWETFVTALEGGIGYWSACEKYRCFKDDKKTENLDGFYADIFDADYPKGDRDANFEPVRIDRDTIAEGYARVLAGPVEYMPESQRGKFVVMVQSRLAGMDDRQVDIDYDAGDADNLVQAALFGSVVFG